MEDGRRTTQAFSLVEVVIAVGIFAAGVAVMVAMLPSLTRQATSSAEALTALRLPDAIQAELQRAAAAGTFDAVANTASVMASPLPATLELVASKDAGTVQTVAIQPPLAAERLAVGDRFFLIEVWRYSQTELAYDPSAANVLLWVRVSWPYYAPGTSAPTSFSSRENIGFAVTLRR